jgi:uncharacterized membrane protein
MLKGLIFLLLLILNSCASESKPLPATIDSQTYVFTCSHDLEFVARTDNREAWLFLSSGTLRLPRTEAETYRSGQTSLQIYGQEATLEVSGIEYPRCKNDRRRAIWEHAKLNGANYRAIGNEPGWALEIRNQESIILVTDYGSTRHEFRLPKAEIDQANRITRYKTEDSGNELVLTISGEACVDSMSGEKFSSKATVVLDEKRLQGCGRALH